MDPRQAGRRWAAALLLLLVLAAPLWAHTRLERSEPVADSVVAPPSVLRLVFNEAVSPAVATVRLLDADSLVRAVGEVARGSEEREIVVPVVEVLPTGVYTVVWQVVGSDGHPVSGHFTFAVSAPAAPDTAFDPVVTDSGALPPFAPEAMVQEEEAVAAFGVESPAFVAARWITFVAMLSVIGAVAFRFLVVAPVRVRNPMLDEVLGIASSNAARVARGAAVFLLLAAGVRLLLQLEALGGVDGEVARVLLAGTTWGWAWFLQVGAALVAMLGGHLAIRGRPAGWALAAGASVGLALSASLSGHAAAADPAVLAVMADALHVLAVAGWLGALLVLVVAGIPAVALDGPQSGRFSGIAAMVTAFSPRALALAGIVVATGAVGMLLHVGSLTALVNTGYGRMLLVKLGLFGLVLAAGAWNWKRVRPALDRGAPPSRLRRSAALELLLAAAVLLATAVLVALPTP